MLASNRPSLVRDPGSVLPGDYLEAFMKRQTFVTDLRWMILTFAVGLWLAAAMAQAQSLSSVLSGAKPAAAQPEPPTDPLGRDTPRNAMYGFLQARRGGNFEKAAQYLNLSRIPSSQQSKIGPERARLLFRILNRDPRFELGQLNNTPDGRQNDGLASDLDKIATEEVNGESIPLYLERIKRDDLQVWLVSADTVQRLPELALLAEPSAIEKLMPAPLTKTRFLGTPVWIWIVLLLIAMLLSLLSRLFSQAAIAVAEPVAKRYLAAPATFRLHMFTEPLRLLLSIAVFRACLGVIAPAALVRDWIFKLLALLFTLGTAALLMRIVDLISDRWISRLDPREKAMSISVMPLAVRFIKICIFILAVLGLLREWGVDITAVLAGVGVGGLAVALAAQKTIENLFGGVSVISDRPVLVGDLCQFGGQIGTIEDIGLRSTRIRTNDRTLVTVPNSQFSTMTLENYSRRDRFWFHPSLLLRRDTPVEKIAEAMKAVEQVLRDHPKVDPTAVPVRFTKIGNEAFQLEVFSYVLTRDGDEFQRVQTDLLLTILREFERIGVRLAVPFQESLTVVSAAKS
jgi:MscS family membrane protein